MELRGKGMDLELVRHGVATPLKNCEPFVAAGEMTAGPMAGHDPRVGVIGTGAMGGGVVESLVRAGHRHVGAGHPG